MAAGRAKLVPPDQQMLDFSAATPTQPAVVTGSSSALLVEVVRAAWVVLGFDVVGDEAFFQFVLACLVEPTLMLDSARGFWPSSGLFRCTGRGCTAVWPGSQGGVTATSWLRLVTATPPETET